MPIQVETLRHPLVHIVPRRRDGHLSRARERSSLSRFSVGNTFHSLPLVRAATENRGAPSTGGGNEEENGKGWIHFVGVGGCGLSALAMLALKQGYEVSGSDIAWSGFMCGLHRAGAKLFVGHSKSHIHRIDGSKRPDAIVISSAIAVDNVEVLHAEFLGIPIYRRDRWLGKITAECKLIAVSGTHGKSTTTAMISYILDAMGLAISAVVGAQVPQFSCGNIIFGRGCEFILEADEYDSCFLGLSPLIAVITNVEWEHADFFKDEEAVIDTFGRFLRRIKDGGHLVICGDSAGGRALLSNFCHKTVSDSCASKNPHYDVTTYGLSQRNEWHASSISSNAEGGLDYMLYHRGHPMAEVHLQLPGVHNVLNSLAAIVAIVTTLKERLELCDILDHVLYYLRKFRGVSRRFEMIGKVHECYIYDDYAHHPTEIRATLQAARQRFPCKKIWVIFQPHTFSRLAAFLEDFAHALSSADHVIVTKVYAARDENVWDIGGKDLADMVLCPSSEYIHSLGNVVDKLLHDISSSCGQEIVILTLGAGDVTTVGRKLFSRLKCTCRQR